VRPISILIGKLSLINLAQRLSVNNITTILFLSLVIVAHAQASEPTVITFVL
jgi:hypothetical protein